MQFFTPVTLPPSPLAFRPETQVLMLGSCFAQHMGQRLVQMLQEEQVCINPFGILYGERVLCEALERLLDGRPLAEKLFFEDEQGLWHSWAHSGAFNASQRETCVRQAETARKEGQRVLSQADALVVTLSTDRHYRLLSQDACIVANCHKQPARLFSEEVDTLSEQVARWTRLLETLQAKHPDLTIIFTLSPYRYAKYGLHESQLSKAKLLLLIDTLCQHFPNCHYFPAYEIVLDELRDYRFYKPDMLHPSEQTIDYVWSRFESWVSSPQWREYASQRGALLRDLAHRPLQPESAAHQQFLARLEQRIATFESHWHTRLPRAPHSDSHNASSLQQP